MKGHSGTEGDPNSGANGLAPLLDEQQSGIILYCCADLKENLSAKRDYNLCPGWEIADCVVSVHNPETRVTFRRMVV